MQKVYGKYEENIVIPEGSSSRISYSVNEEEYNGFQVYAPVDFLNAFSQIWKEYDTLEQ
jgi:hypothetical protein